MNKMVTIVLMLCLADSTLHAERYTDQNGNNNQESNKFIVGVDVPETPKTSRYLYPRLQRDRVELNTASHSMDYKNIQVQEDHRKKVLGGVYDVDISMKPEYRILQKIDFIKLSPKYITAILLPPNVVITDAKASFPTNIASFTNNTMRIQPKDGFYSGNISVAFSDGKKNYYLTIVGERYFQNRSEVNDFISAVKMSRPSIAKELEKKNKSTDDYSIAKEHMALVYQYMLPSVLSPEDAIMLYERMTKSKGIDITDGDFVSFMYDGITYKIKRDDKQGTLIYGKKAYIVENSLSDKQI